MKVAYLVNQYPSTSHTFIRREILALEELGMEVSRFSLRPMAKSALADAADHAELAKTRAVQAVGPIGLLMAFVICLFTRPMNVLRGLALAVKIGRRSDRGMANHLAYLIEACVLFRWLEADGCQHVHAHFGTNSTAVAMLCAIYGHARKSCLPAARLLCCFWSRR